MERFARPLLILLAVLLLAGCQKKPRFMDPHAYWIGLPDNKLILDWGAPDSEYEFKGGRKILTWRHSRVVEEDVETFTVVEQRVIDGQVVDVPVNVQKPGRVQRFECITNFELSKRGIVRDYSFNGNECMVPKH